MFTDNMIAIDYPDYVISDEGERIIIDKPLPPNECWRLIKKYMNKNNLLILKLMDLLIF